MYVDINFKYTRRNDLTVRNESHVCDLLFIHSIVQNFNLPTQMWTLNVSFENVLNTYYEQIKCIIVGDFNINQIETFVNNLISSGFYPTISKPTKITSSTAALIDSIMTNITKYNIVSGIIYSDILDHFPVFNIYELDSKLSKHKYNFIE